MTHDAIVIGAGVIGTSIAYHLAAFGARNVVVLDRGTIGAGTSSQSSGILRTHYSVPENVELARRRGVKIIEGVEVERLLLDDGRVVGVDTSQGRFGSATVVSAQNIWARDIERWTGIETPVRAERHSVLALAGPEPYASTMPVY